MARLTGDNCEYQKESGAVIFHRSPESIKIKELEQKVDELTKKVNLIMSILQGGNNSGEFKVEE